VTDHNWIMSQAERLKATGETSPRLARDPVNQPQIHTWLEAIGDPNPVYRDTPEAARLHGGPVAPPAMSQVWTMYGLDPHRPAGDLLHAMMQVMDEAGFTSVLGTNCDQTYDRYLRPGEQVSVTTLLESVVGPKKTGVGEGYFVTTKSVWRVGDEPVATMLFRVLKFKPQPRTPMQPAVSQDSAFFWEGTAAGELRIQSCNACGLLRHPPGPMCPSCRATDRGYVVSPGRGRVYSYVTHHAPQVPGKQLPLLLAVVETDEGIRYIGEVRGAAGERLEGGVEIGSPVQVGFERIDDDLTLVVWRLTDESATVVDASQGARPESTAHDTASQGAGDDSGQVLPAWELPITPTLVVSTALATRDFQDVHHDRDLAVQRGSRDIFLNILTTTGLVQRYVGEWAGPAALTRACELRLGAPGYPGDTVSFQGMVSDVVEVDGEVRHVVDVVGTVSLGSHVTARVTVVLPTGAGEQR
jgi:uncharacterized OB-fold protein